MDWNSLFEYRDGALYRAVTRGKWKKGTRVGYTRKDGYRVVQVGPKTHKEHRIIYEIHHGPIPEGMVIDHIDRNPSNNNIDNLRVVSQTTNMFNRVGKGYYWRESKQRYIVKVRQKQVGSCKTEEEAREMYLSYKRKEGILLDE